MRIKHLLHWAGLAAVLLTGCASAPPKFPGDAHASSLQGTTITRSLAPDLLQPPAELFVTGPGDQLDIGLLSTNSAPETVAVGLDGKIYYSFLPGIDVWGLTLAQTKARIEKEFSGFYTMPPQVSVTLRSVGSRSVWLLGRLTKPGIYPLAGSMTLIEALSLAGGTAKTDASFTTQDLGDLRHSFVLRQGRPLPVDFTRLLEQGDMSQNIYLLPDDFVYIPSSLSQQVYVLGAVATPRTVPYSDNMTVISALAGANGPIKYAYLSHIGVIRGSLNQPKLIEVDYKAVVTGKAPNLPLEPGDIVYVPLTPYHVLSDYADLIVTTFVRSWSANMGIRAVTGSSSLGVSVPVGTVRTSP